MPPLRRAGVGTEGVDLGEDGDVQVGVFAYLERGAHAGQPGADNEHVMFQQRQSLLDAPGLGVHPTAAKCYHLVLGAFN